MNQAKLTFIHALSPLHAGTGQGVGVIDLPIARERATNLPYLPGSTLKGTLRDEGESAFGKERAGEIFGEGGDDTGKAGAVIFSDQRLLCLPVRSLFGTFAWTTSPYILERFKRDCQNINHPIENNVPAVSNDKCAVSSASMLKSGDNRVILEDLDLQIESEDVTAWATLLGQKIFPNDSTWQNFFAGRFCIVSDDVMNFLAETATETTARNVLSENKTSDNLWYEESLPTETILSGLLVVVNKNGASASVFDDVARLAEKPLQLGGNMTVGRGLCRILIER
jgi:CRISPR-associated protein Cmr4